MPFLLNHLQLLIPELEPILFRLLFRTPCYFVCTTTVLPNTSYNYFARIPRKTPSSIVQNASLLVRYLAVDVLLLLGACVAGMCLSTRCLARGIHFTIRYVKQTVNKHLVYS
jgi:hypothetical protein